MRKILIFILLMACALQASAQHDHYNWHVKGYVGIADYYNPDQDASTYFSANNHLLYRFELGKSLGNTFGVAASATYGHVQGWGVQGNSFTTEARMISGRLYFYTDNGWIFNTSAQLSPYFFGGYGLSTLQTTVGSETQETRRMPVVPFGVGLKFRLTDRLQLNLQAEAIYNTKQHLAPLVVEQNKHNNSILHGGLALAYSFGQKESTFKAPRFYVGKADTYATSGGELLPQRADRSMLDFILQVQPKPVQLGHNPSADSLTKAARQQLPLTSPGDSLIQDAKADLAIIPFTSRLVTVDTTNQQNQAGGVTKYTLVPVDSMTVNPPAVTVPAGSRQMVYTDTDTSRAAAAARRGQADTTRTAPSPRTRAATASRAAADTVRQQTNAVVADTKNKQKGKQKSKAQRNEEVKDQEQAARSTEVDREVEEEHAENLTTTAPVRQDPIRVQQPATRTQIQQRTVYVPIDRSYADRSGQRDRTMTLLLDNDRRRLEAANRTNRQLRSNLDSLNALQANDAMAAEQETENASYLQNDSVLHYMDEQAALNDSILQRLTLYQVELQRLQAPAARAVTPGTTAPATTAVAVPVAVSSPAPVSDSTNVFFAFNSAKVPMESYNSLLTFVRLLKDNPDLQLLLAGYTDQQGDPNYNLVLSRKRAEAVSAFFQEQGIAKERIRAEYKGEASSANKSVNPVNRRVTLYLH
ncbi:OmpA family protein [Pontibacter chitinilyticus]|uniref:OmpA family protein n=1 Tax=Pontibacter chitinilyticus TaxID=2674989 RepID=UPI003219F00A